MRENSNFFQMGAFFRSIENSGGNSIGALFPIIHMATDSGTIKELSEHPRKISKNIVINGSLTSSVSQAIYREVDQIDVAQSSGKEYTTNYIIFLGCKVLELGSRTAQGLEKFWQRWTNIHVLKAYLLKEKICVQNISFMKQIVPQTCESFSYIILFNIKLVSLRDVTMVLDGLQRMRGSVVAAYAALYNVVGDVSRSRSEESMERLIQTVSDSGADSRRSRAKRSKDSRRRPRSVNTV